MRRIILLGLACGLLIGSTGCMPLCALLCPGTMCNDPYAPVAAGCGPVACGPACGESCGPVVPSEPLCGTTCDATCARRGPLDFVFALFRGDAWYGPSCGETYFGDYYSEPPVCCEPCDQYGNFTGQGMNGYGPSTMTSPMMVVEPTPAMVRSPGQLVR